MACVTSEFEVLRQFYSQIEAVLDPEGVAKLLWQDSVLTDDQLDNAELTSTSAVQRRSDILSTVRRVVRGDPEKLWVFIKALEQFPGSMSIAKKMRNELTMKSITCSATSPATATPSTAVSATSATNTLTVTELSNRTAQSPICAGELIVSEIYKKDFDELQYRFIKLFLTVTEILEKDESVSIESIIDFLSCYPNLQAQLQDINNIKGIILLVKQHSSFINCSCLKFLVQHLNVPTAIEKIDEYYKTVDDFCQYTVKQHTYAASFFADNSRQLHESEAITLKLQWSPDSKTLADIQGVLRKAFKHLTDNVHIVVVKEGSVTVICFATQHIIDHLVGVAQANEDSLVEDGVIYLKVGSITVIDNSELKATSKEENLAQYFNFSIQITEMPVVPTTSQRVWQITAHQAELLLSGMKNGTFLIRERHGTPLYDQSNQSVLTHGICVVANEKIVYVAIYKRNNHYGFLHNEWFSSIDTMIVNLSRTGFTLKDSTIVKLTDQLFPNKDTLAKLTSNIIPSTHHIKFSDVASLPKHYPHHYESTWFCRLLSRKDSLQLLSGKVDETFLVRATDLSGPNHVYTVDVVVQRNVVSLCVYNEGGWLHIHTWEEGYDSINTLVLYNAVTAHPVILGNHMVLTQLRHPVNVELQSY